MTDLSSVELIIIIGVVLIAFLPIIFYFFHKGKLSLLRQQINLMTDENSALIHKLDRETGLLNQSYEEKEEIRIQLVRTEQELIHMREKYEDFVQDSNSMQERFEILANKVLESKSQKFEIAQKKGLEQVLDPLKEKIKSFEEKVEKTNKESIERHSSLRSQISYLKEVNDKMTTETKNLTRALKGENKLQGNWGELILESILEKSGLEKNREYFIQNSFTNGSGRILRPDVIIHLPDEKKIIIDSKVSIKAYEQLVNSTDENRQKELLKTHSLSIKNHIDGLAAKSYHDIYQIDSPDFVLMFIPIDTAFSASLSDNPSLYGYAFDKNIVIVTPATLLATLKTIDTMWKNDKQQRHALEIASEAGKMYDKFSALIEDLVSLGKRIDQTKGHYEESMKKLHYGRGDLISRAEKLKSLGVKVKKDIAKSLVERSLESN